jgi:hypothetical protein
MASVEQLRIAYSIERKVIGVDDRPGVPKSVEDSVVHTVSPFRHLSSGAFANSLR